MKLLTKPVLFLITSVFGIAAGVIIAMLAINQYLGLTSFLQNNPGAVTILGSSLINSEETGYLIIVISAVPLIALSLWLMQRSVKRLNLPKSKHRR